MGKSKDIVEIKTKDDLDYLVHRVQNGPTFANLFRFESDQLLEKFLTSIDIAQAEFNEKGFTYIDETKLHIAQNEEGYTWISSIGLVAQRGAAGNIENKYVKACLAQVIVVSLLLDKALSLCEEEDIYNIDSYNYEYLNQFTLALFHNIIFNFEIFCKAYLSINNVPIKKTHKLSKILQKVEETIFALNHNNTVFHAYIVGTIKDTVEYLNKLPGDFREENIKYEDNSEDYTVIVFDKKGLSELRYIIELCNDFIFDYYHMKDTEHALYLNQGLFNRILELAKNDVEKQRIIDTYGYLVKSL